MIQTQTEQNILKNKMDKLEIDGNLLSNKIIQLAKDENYYELKRVIEAKETNIFMKRELKAQEKGYQLTQKETAEKVEKLKKEIFEIEPKIVLRKLDGTGLFDIIDKFFKENKNDTKRY